MVVQFRRPGGQDEEDPGAGQVAGEVAECLPGRAVGQVHVVEDDDHRPVGRQPGQQLGEASRSRTRGGSATGREPVAPATAGSSAVRSSRWAPPGALTSSVGNPLR